MMASHGGGANAVPAATVARRRGRATRRRNAKRIAPAPERKTALSTAGRTAVALLGIVENDTERKAFTGLDGTHPMAVVGSIKAPVPRAGRYLVVMTTASPCTRRITRPMDWALGCCSTRSKSPPVNSVSDWLRQQIT